MEYKLLGGSTFCFIGLYRKEWWRKSRKCEENCSRRVNFLHPSGGNSAAKRQKRKFYVFQDEFFTIWRLLILIPKSCLKSIKLTSFRRKPSVALLSLCRFYVQATEAHSSLYDFRELFTVNRSQHEFGVVKVVKIKINKSIEAGLLCYKPLISIQLSQQTEIELSLRVKANKLRCKSFVCKRKSFMVAVDVWLLIG